MWPRSWRRRAAERNETGREHHAPLTGRPDALAASRDLRRARTTAAQRLPRKGTAGWERPRSGGGDGAVRPHPPRCRLRHAEMGGLSQPRPRSADLHRRSAGRGATESAPAAYGTGGMYIAGAISCPATREAPCTLVDRHRHGPPALKTGLPAAVPREAIDHRSEGVGLELGRAARGRAREALNPEV